LILCHRLCLPFLPAALLFFSLLAPAGCKTAPGPGNSSLPGHPRLILSGGFLELTRERCRSSRKELFERLRETVDKYIGESADSLQVRQQARLAEKCAFFCLIEGDRKYLQAGLSLLDRALDRYIQLEREQGGGYWEAVEFRRYCCFAYDWMFQAMSGEERKRLGDKILQAGNIAWEKYYGFSPYDGGGYGSLDPLFWPAVTLACTGIRDSIAEVWLDSTKANIHLWRQMQEQVAADDGGMYSGMAYASYNYLRTPIYDFEIWKNLTGEDLAQDNPYLKYFTIWWLYCLKPNLEWLRIDDAGSIRGSIQPWHFKYLASRYSDRVSRWYLETRAEQPASTIWDVIWDPGDLGIQPEGPDKSWPLARHFEGIGWVIMRSGWDDEATHAVFDCGDFYYSHQHATENSFVIFKKGSLAINSGRYEWGSNHRPNYTARSISSNTILVYDPEEEFRVKGETERTSDGELISNDGGQLWPKPYRESYGDSKGTPWDTGDIVAFETNPHYSYVCGDATRAYNPKKLKLFTRQFIHIQPDLFIVFDRVEAANPEYKKFWLLHSVNEPSIKGALAEISEREGRLFCRTVYPRDAIMQKTGGPGHEFEVFGANYPPKMTHYPLGEDEEWGSWRIEVVPGKPRAKDFFLHVLLAGNSSLSQAPEIKPIDDNTGLGVELICAGKICRAVFNRDGSPGGRLKITGPQGAVLIDKPLSEEVQPQAGIGN